MQRVKKYFNKRKKMRVKFTAKTFLLSQILCLGLMNLGFGLGYSSPTLRELLQLNLLDNTTYPIFVSLFLFGIALGAILSIPTSKYLGRKFTINLSSLFGGLGWLLIAGGTDTGYLMVGRLCSGSAAGIYLATAPIFLGEITPVEARGFLSGFQGLYEIAGIILVYVLGIFLSFRWLAIVGLLLILIQAIFMLIQPYSPVWLYSRGLERTAKKVLISIRKEGSDVSEECLAIHTALQANKKTMSLKYYVSVICVKYRLKALSLGALLALGFINTGVDIVNAYTSPLLENRKLVDSNVVAICVPIFGIIGAFLALFLVEPCGRKPLMLTSTCLVTCMMISLMGYFMLTDKMGLNCTSIDSGNSLIESNIQGCRWIILWPVLSLAMLKFGYQIGWGSVLYVIFGEMLPIRIKEFGAGLILSVMNVHGILILTIFPYISEAIGKGYTFLILVILNIVSCIALFLFLPETKRLRADEIEDIFQENSILCGLNLVSNSYSLENEQSN